jgi:hypothetical protein
MGTAHRAVASLPKKLKAEIKVQLSSRHHRRLRRSLPRLHRPELRIICQRILLETKSSSITFACRVFVENADSLISVSPDGNYLAYTYYETASRSAFHLAVIPTSGGPPVNISESQ